MRHFRGVVYFYEGEYERGGVEGGERAIKKLVLFVLVLLALMAATAFLVVTWLRAEDAEERAVRAENQTALQVEELRKSEEARSVSKWEVGRLSQELSNSRGVETRLRQALVNEQAEIGSLRQALVNEETEVGRLNQELKNANEWYGRTVRAHDEAQAEVNRLNQELRNVQSVARVGGSSHTSSNSQAVVNSLRQTLRTAQAEVNRLRSELRRAQQSSTSESGLVRELVQSIGCDAGGDASLLIRALGFAASVWVGLAPEWLWSWLLGGICDWLASYL